MRNYINVSQKNNLVLVKLNSDAEFEDIILNMKKKLVQLKKLYKDEKTPMMITGKVLKNKEMDELEELIKEKLDIEVDFDMPKELGLYNIKKTFIQEVSTSETKFHKGSLRSGQKLIQEKGSIVILGDVNSGAEVVAEDNIVVLGALRGLAHAGASGNTKAIISAGRLDTVQIRIANIVKEIDRDGDVLRKLSYVYVDLKKEKIIIE